MKIPFLPVLAAAITFSVAAHADQPKYITAAIADNAIAEYNTEFQYTGRLVDGLPLIGPQHGCLDPTGELLYIPQNNGGSSIQCYNVRTGVLLSHIMHPSFIGLTFVTFSPDGHLIISDFSGARIYKWDVVTNTMAGVAVESGHLMTPHEVLYHDGSMYVSDWQAGKIVQFDEDGTFNRVLNGGSHLVGPLGMVLSEDEQSLIVVNNFTNNLARFRLSDGAWTGDLVSPGGSGLVWAEGVDVGHDGNLVVASAGNGTIRRFDRTTGAFLGAFSTGGVVGAVDVIYVAPKCPADINNNSMVDFGDLLTALASWGPCPACDSDVDLDGSVGFTDILTILAAWGPCGS